MQRTRFKYVVLLICMAVMSSIAYAEKGDNTVPPSVGEQPAALTTTSYFQGTWFGNWQIVGRGGSGRDITIKVGPQNPEGSFDIEYSWGIGRTPNGRPISPGTVKSKGREDGGKLKFEFFDPISSTNNDIVMEKYEDVKAKALMEYGMMKLVAYLTR